MPTHAMGVQKGKNSPFLTAYGGTTKRHNQSLVPLEQFADSRSTATSMLRFYVDVNLVEYLCISGYSSAGIDAHCIRRD